MKLPNGQNAVVVDIEDTEIEVGEAIVLDVDATFRGKVKKNHSATHLLNQSLRNVLGAHVVQQGSLNNDERLRFDFNHYANVSTDELLKIEALTNEAIKHGYPVKTILTSIEEAKKHGAQALFSEKYGDVVRMVDMDYSVELCGGTHVANTSEIEKLAILSIESKGSGIFRVEAATSSNIEPELNKVLEPMMESLNDTKKKISELVAKAKSLKMNIVEPKIEVTPLIGSYQDILNKRSEVANAQKELRNLEKEVANFERTNNSLSVKDYLDRGTTLGDTYLLVERLDNADLNAAKDLIDNLTASLSKAFVLMAVVMGEKIIFVAKNKNTGYNAGAMVKEAAIITGGNGGGRPDFAQAGGKEITKLDEALGHIKEMVGLK